LRRRSRRPAQKIHAGLNRITSQPLRLIGFLTDKILTPTNIASPPILNASVIDCDGCRDWIARQHLDACHWRQRRAVGADRQRVEKSRGSV
jgi:hypothetical protein